LRLDRTTSWRSVIMPALHADQQTRSPVWALEHIESWAEQVRTWLRRYAVDTVEVCPAELHDYGSFTLVRPTSQAARAKLLARDMRRPPPGDTPGGRYGLFPVMRKSLSLGCVILLDDIKRPGERAALSRWSEELGQLQRSGRSPEVGKDHPAVTAYRSQASATQRSRLPAGGCQRANLPSLHRSSDDWYGGPGCHPAGCSSATKSAQMGGVVSNSRVSFFTKT
jgi:hypothetical protein